MNISWNWHKNWLSRPHLPIVWHQARQIWLMLKFRWFMKRFTWRSNEIRGCRGCASIFRRLFVSELLIGQEIGIRPIRRGVSFDLSLPVETESEKRRRRPLEGVTIDRRHKMIQEWRALVVYRPLPWETAGVCGRSLISADRAGKSPDRWPAGSYTK